MVLFISSWRSRILSSRSNCLRKSSAEVFTRGSILTSNDRVCALRSEEHTSELQSRLHLVCRLLLEKKKQHLFAKPLCPHLPNHPYRRTDNVSRTRPLQLAQPREFRPARDAACMLDTMLAVALREHV